MAAGYRLGPGRRTVNRIIRALLRLGPGPRRTYLLTVGGHRSGAPRSTPVTLVEDGGRRWLVSPYGEVAWVRNLRGPAGHALSRRTDGNDSGERDRCGRRRAGAQDVRDAR